jgi:hypothetical protein
MQESIWTVRPDLIIETGIAHGGSLIFSASMLAQLDLCDAIETGAMLDPRKSKRKVLGIDIRDHNRKAIETHPMASRIQMIQDSSIDSGIIKQVHEIAAGYSNTLICLDSNHTHAHVTNPRRLYGSTSKVILISRTTNRYRTSCRSRSLQTAISNGLDDMAMMASRWTCRRLNEVASRERRGRKVAVLLSASTEDAYVAQGAASIFARDCSRFDLSTFENYGCDDMSHLQNALTDCMCFGWFRSPILTATSVLCGRGLLLHSVPSSSILHLTTLSDCAIACLRNSFEVDQQDALTT